MSQIDFRKLQGWPYFWVGGGLTAVYLLALSVLFGRVLCQLFSPNLEVNALGDTLAGIFAPLAFIWLVVSLLQQGREIQIQVIELRESVAAQKMTADASSGQTKLQNEQFFERTYRLYKVACEDVLFQILARPNIVYLDERQQSAVLVSDKLMENLRERFENGDRSAVLSMAAAIQTRLANDMNASAGHGRQLVRSPTRKGLLALAEDFVRFDDRRLAALSQFEGGDVLQKVDSHEGFDTARRLAESYVAFLKSNP